jgi:thioesterase domain-containing protein
MRASISDTSWEFDVDEGEDVVLPETEDIESDLVDWAVKADALEEEAETLKRMMKRLQERKKAREEAVEKIRQKVLERMKDHGKTTVKTPGLTVSRRKVPAKVKFAGDLSAVPRWCIRLKEEPDNAKAKEHWKQTGEVLPGWEEVPEGETVSFRF